jgi:Uma2 family endonuclease
MRDKPAWRKAGNVPFRPLAVEGVVLLMNVLLPPSSPVVYPESDGLPMSDNTRQFLWIQLIFANLAALFADRADVFVCGNQFWYPVEGHPEINSSPDVYVVFGRPKGHRSSYKQWEEGNVPMTVVFEILSPSNTVEEMDDKRLFYEEYGVEEYYVFNPDTNHLLVFVRNGEVLRRVRPLEGHVSPRLGVRFDFSGVEMVIMRPDGRPFQTLEEAGRERDQIRKQAARLAELSRKARRGQANTAEVEELERLEEQASPPSP